MPIGLTDEQIAQKLRNTFRLLRRVEGSLKIMVTDDMSVGAMQSLSKTALEDISAAFWDLNLIGKSVGMER
jgi:hypothetical protein